MTNEFVSNLVPDTAWIECSLGGQEHGWRLGRSGRGGAVAAHGSIQAGPRGNLTVSGAQNIMWASTLGEGDNATME